MVVVITFSCHFNYSNNFNTFIYRYPLYQRGNPQLRVFLPNFWLKLIRPVHEQPPNVVQFACSMQMTKYDIKNYLEKIYNVPIIDVRTRIQLGKTKRDLKGYIVKEEDTKLAYVTLVRNININSILSEILKHFDIDLFIYI